MATWLPKTPQTRSKSKRKINHNSLLRIKWCVLSSANSSIPSKNRGSRKAAVAVACVSTSDSWVLSSPPTTNSTIFCSWCLFWHRECFDSLSSTSTSSLNYQFVLSSSTWVLLKIKKILPSSGRAFSLTSGSLSTLCSSLSFQCFWLASLSSLPTSGEELSEKSSKSKNLRDNWISSSGKSSLDLSSVSLYLWRSLSSAVCIWLHSVK